MNLSASLYYCQNLFTEAISALCCALLCFGAAPYHSLCFSALYRPHWLQRASLDLLRDCHNPYADTRKHTAIAWVCQINPVYPSSIQYIFSRQYPCQAVDSKLQLLSIRTAPRQYWLPVVVAVTAGTSLVVGALFQLCFAHSNSRQ